MNKFSRPVTSFYVGSIVSDNLNVLGNNPKKEYLFYQKKDKNFICIGELFNGKPIVCKLNDGNYEFGDVVIKLKCDLTSYMTTKELETYLTCGISFVEAYLIYEDNCNIKRVKKDENHMLKVRKKRFNDLKSKYLV